jgi:hypothetical protein
MVARVPDKKCKIAFQVPGAVLAPTQVGRQDEPGVVDRILGEPENCL